MKLDSDLLAHPVAVLALAPGGGEGAVQEVGGGVVALQLAAALGSDQVPEGTCGASMLL